MRTLVNVSIFGFEIVINHYPVSRWGVRNERDHLAIDLGKYEVTIENVNNPLRGCPA